MTIEIKILVSKQKMLTANCEKVLRSVDTTITARFSWQHVWRLLAMIHFRSASALDKPVIFYFRK